jgi:hypothetical protein
MSGFNYAILDRLFPSIFIEYPSFSRGNTWADYDLSPGLDNPNVADGLYVWFGRFHLVIDRVGKTGCFLFFLLPRMIDCVRWFSKGKAK